MLDEKFYHIVWLTFSTASYIGAIPFTFDRETKQFKWSTFTTILHRFWLVMAVLTGTFIFFQTLRFHHIGDPQSFNMCYCFLLAYGLVCSSISVSSSFPQHLLLLLNGFLVFFTRISSKCKH